MLKLYSMSQRTWPNSRLIYASELQLHLKLEKYMYKIQITQLQNHGYYSEQKAEGGKILQRRGRMDFLHTLHLRLHRPVGFHNNLN